MLAHLRTADRGIPQRPEVALCQPVRTALQSLDGLAPFLLLLGKNLAFDAPSIDSMARPKACASRTCRGMTLRDASSRDDSARNGGRTLMNGNRVLIFVVVAGGLSLCEPAVAQWYPDSNPVVVTFLDRYDVLEGSFHNLPDPDGQTDLSLDVFMTCQDFYDSSADIEVWFGWIDPAKPPSDPPSTSPATTFRVSPGQLRHVIHDLTLPFNPTRVSFHIQHAGGGQPVLVHGTFYHGIIPEPSTFSLAAIALGAMAQGRVAKRRRLEAWRL